MDASDRRYYDRRLRHADPGVDRRGAGWRGAARLWLMPAEAETVVARVTADLDRTDGSRPWRTSTYLDTADLRLYHAGLAGATAALRVREYHAEDPSRVLVPPRLWVEWIDQAAGSERKRRLVLRPAQLEDLLHGRIPIPDPRSLALSDEELAVVHAGLLPQVVAKFHRDAWTSRRAELRVTVDHTVTYWWPRSPERRAAIGLLPLGMLVGAEPRVRCSFFWTADVPPDIAALIAELGPHAEADARSEHLRAMHRRVTAPVRRR